MSNYKAIGLRAVNSYQYISPLTSLGVKMILDQFNGDSVDIILPKILERKIEVNKKFNTNELKIIKGKDEDGNYEYRTLTFPSPFNALLESYYFYKLDSNKVNSSSSVYSYRLNKPSNRSFHVFDYFMKNYLKMNFDIATKLKNSPEKGVLILDIKSFYPSIDNKVASTILQERGLSSMILEDSVSSRKGITIGSNFSHLVAQEFLKNFDNSMSQKYQNNYFRYVDDIFIICDESKHKEVVNDIQSKLPKGLTLNQSKLDFMNSSYWIDNIEQFDSKNRLDSFFNVVKTYLRYNFDEIESIDNELKDNGIYIPTFRLENEIKTSSFYKLFSWMSEFGNRKYLSSRRWNNKDFIGYVKSQKSFHLKGLKSTIEMYRENNASKKMHNRFCSQKIKYHIGSLYYLLSDDELKQVMNDLPKDDDAFIPIFAIIKAITEHDLSLAIKCGAKTVSTVSELWNSRGNPTINIDLSTENYSSFIDSIIYLIIMDVIDIDLAIAKNNLDFNAHNYLASVLNLTIDSGELPEYLKEIKALFSRYNKEQIKDMLLSRLDKDETIFSLENSSHY